MTHIYIKQSKSPRSSAPSSAQFRGLLWHALIRRKVLVFSLLFLLVTLPIFLLVTKYKSKVEAAWMDDAWGFRKAVAIPSHTTLETNVYVTVPTFDATDTSKFQADCGDLRFTKQNGEQLPYYVVDCDATANIHVQFDSLPAGASTYYLYYGNPSVANGFSSADFATAATGLGTQVLASEEKSAGPVAYWKFDEGYGTSVNDQTPNSNTGTISGATWQSEDQCISGKCLKYSNTFINTNYTSINNSASLSQSENLSISTWFKANTQPTSNANYKVLVIVKGSSGTNLVDQYTAAGYNVVTDTGVTTVEQVAAYSPDIVLCDMAYWGCSGSATLLNALYDAGYIVVTKGNDTYNNIYPISTSHGGTHSNTTISPNEKHPLGNGWSSTGNSGTDTGQIIDTIHASAISIAKNGADFTEIIYLEQPNKGRWFHYQAYGTLDSTLFSNMNAFLLRYNIIGKGKNYNLYTYNGSLYGYVNNQKLSGTISYNSWNHANLVYDKTGGNIYLYLNGKQLATAAYSTALDTDSLNISLGSLMKGFIDEPKVYNYARTAAQIKSDYASKGSGTIKGTAVSMGSNAKNSDALSNGLVGYWKQDEASWTQDCSTASVIDSSGNGLNGKSCESTTGPAGGAVGKFGNSGDFDGSDDNVAIADNALLRAGAVWSTAAWFKLDTTGSDKRIVDKTNDGTGYALVANSTTPQFWTGNGSTYDALNGTSTIATGTWYHIVGTVENGVKKIYINGNLENTASITFNGVGTGVAFRIGTRNATTQTVDGKIDDVRIYNRALSGKEVRDLYAWAPGPVGYWNFEEGTTGTSYDSSSNGFNGTDTGTTSVSGKFGKGRSFNGSNDLSTISDSSLLRFGTGDFTIESWVKFPINGSLGWEGIITKGYTTGAPANTWGLVRNSTLSNGIAFQDTTDGGGSWNGDMRIASISDGWHHFAALRSGTSYKMYMDGILTISQTKTVVNLSTTANIKLGSDASNRFLNGSIDDTKIYNYARTSGQITEDMNAGHPLGGSPVGSQIGYWKFDEGHDTTANNSGSGGSTLNGTISNATWNNNGKYNKALDFNGSSGYVTSSIPNPGNATTISFWSKMDSYGADTGDYSAFFDFNMQYQVKGIEHFTNGVPGSRSLKFWGYYAGNQIQLNQAITPIDGSEAAFLGKWHHYSLVFSPGANKLYIDGKLSVTDTNANSVVFDSSNTLNLGRKGNGTRYFDGMLDEVKIYNAALTADEIKLDYNRGSAMVLGDSIENRDRVTSGQTLYLDATDKRSYPGSGTVWNDLSGNNYNATLSSPTWNGLKFTNTAATLTNLGSSVYPNIATNTTILWVYPEVGGGSVWQVTDMDAHTYMSYLGTAYINTWETGTYAQRTTWAIAAGVPHQIVITKNGSVRTVYDNLVQKGQVTITNIATSVNTNLIYGATAQPMGLSIVETYNRVLSTDEITQDYYAHAYKFNINAGPVGEWNFEEKTGITTNDTSGNGNVGTLTNGPTWSSGKIGTGINFAGDNDFISTGITTHPSSFTVEAWAKADVSDGTIDTIISKFEASPYDGFFLRHSNGTMTAAVYNAGTGYSSTTTITAGVWNHWSMTFNGTTITLYKDGVQVDSDAGTMSSASQALVIGGNYTGTSEPFDGKIDNVKYFNYARTPAQIAYDYNRGGPVGWWKMDECQGIAANDSSGNGNNGNITIGATGTNTTAGTCTGSAGEAWKDGAIGKYNSSLEFDGTDDYITTSANWSNKFSGGITLSAWVKFPNTTNYWRAITIENAANTTYDVWLQASITSGIVQFGSGGSGLYKNGSTNISNNSWHHIVGVTDYTSGGTKIYVDGKDDGGTVIGTPSYTATKGVLDIGRLMAGGLPYYATGQIDDVRIYNYALTPQQIKTVYNSGAAVQFAPSTGSP